MRDKICYLCGKEGADSDDHVPPKCLLPESQYQKYQRITIPAHIKCNSITSSDEEYVRDMLIMEAKALNLPKHELITPKVWRAWQREPGFKRYSNIIKTAIPINLQTKSGIFAGKAISVKPDIARFENVGRKIIKGMIYHDTGAICNMDNLPIVTMTSEEMVKIREKDDDNPFWIGINSENCLHNMCADTIAIRRFYECINNNNTNFIIASFVIMLWNCVFLSSLEFPLDVIKNKKFKFCINTNNWVYTE